MIAPGTGVRVYLACGVTDMRKGINGLSALAQDVLRQKATNGAVFAFRGRRGDRIKLLYWDGQGFCLYYKVQERGRFPWPSAADGEPFSAIGPRTMARAADFCTAGDVVGGHRLATAKLGRTTGPGWVIYIGLSALFIWRYPLRDGIQHHVEYRAFSPQ